MSDKIGFTSEQVCATRGATPEASDKFMKTWNSYNDFILKEATDDLSESQPTAGNIACGLTTFMVKLVFTMKKQEYPSNYLIKI